MEHQLKIWPEFFARVRGGFKAYEVRKNDRGFRVGDRLILREWSPENGYSGEFVEVTVSRVDYLDAVGVPGYVVLEFPKVES